MCGVVSICVGWWSGRVRSEEMAMKTRSKTSSRDIYQFRICALGGFPSDQYGVTSNKCCKTSCWIAISNDLLYLNDFNQLSYALLFNPVDCINLSHSLMIRSWCSFSASFHLIFLNFPSPVLLYNKTQLQSQFWESLSARYSRVQPFSLLW